VSKWLTRCVQSERDKSVDLALWMMRRAYPSTVRVISSYRAPVFVAPTARLSFLFAVLALSPRFVVLSPRFIVLSLRSSNVAQRTSIFPSLFQAVSDRVVCNTRVW
jgi:hypothetical protein